MRQVRPGRSRLQQALDGGVRGCGEMLAGTHVVRFAQHIQQAGKHRRDQQDAEHRQGPEQGRGKQRPAQQQQQRQRRRHQAAAQVVEQLPARQQRTADCVASALVGPGPASSQATSCQSPRIQR
jgi:hypothetical protein